MQETKKVFWFVVGSQHLYGEETLKQVSDNAKVIVEGLNQSAPFEIVLKDTVKTAHCCDFCTTRIRNIEFTGNSHFAVSHFC